MIVSMIRPTAMLAMLSDDANLAKVAAEVEKTMNNMLTETVGS